MAIELYDLSNDIKEENDLAAQHPDIVSEIEAIMIDAHIPSTNDRFKFPQLGD